MMLTPGNNGAVVIGDSDGLIALLHAEDSNHPVAKAAIEGLAAQDVQIIFPLTTIAETITTLQRRLREPALAAQIVERLRDGALTIEPVDASLLDAALEMFQPSASKQHTLFDALVAATARKYQTRAIFSFDHWYRSLGFSLASDVVESMTRAA